MSPETKNRPLARAACNESNSPDYIKTDWPALVHSYQQSVSPHQLARFARELGLTVTALQKLEIGRDENRCLWCWPERDALGQVIGIATRDDQGGKACIPGSRRGLTMPWPLPTYTGTSYREPILLIEGATDCAAGLDLGFATIGRPSATGGLEHLTRLLGGLHVAVVGENDGQGADDPQRPGKIGAEKIANGLVGEAESVRLIYPPSDIKDLRAWLVAHGLEATRRELLEKIAAAPKYQPATGNPGLTNGPDYPGDVCPKLEQAWPKKLAPEACYGLAGRIVQAIEPHTEADPAALLIDLLVSFGSAAGRQAHCVVDGAAHYPNLFAVLVGATSKGRKGTARANIHRVFEEADPKWAANRVVSGLSSGEGLIWQVRDPISKREVVRERGKMVDYHEVETDPGEADKRLLIVENEFSNVLKVASREGNTLSPVIRLAWDKGDLRALTKNSPARATGAHISILGHITGDELRRYLDSTEAANGFGNRFLWVCARRSKCLPEGGCPPLDALKALVNELAEALVYARQARVMRRDNDARELWATVYPQLSEGAPGLFGAVTSRAEAQVLRLSMVYALLDRSELIRVPHLFAALAVWVYAEQSARHIFGEALGDAVADELLQAIRRAGDQGLTRTQIRDLFSRHRASHRINAALNDLLKTGLARVEQKGTGGRPTERWLPATYVT